MSGMDRPEPESLLSEANKEGRGRLKIFLGAAPGVGKTFAMLEAARLRKKEGVDVVIGVAETHGRAETDALLAGLETIPKKSIVYRDKPFAEMDLDGLLARKPKLAIIDELAHTNVPGSRHTKRYQDVEEVLAAGIDVYSTLNIQHIESLNDIVARISRIRVRETLPDSVLEMADEVELVDLPPEELIQRLREGKVYIREQAGRAIANFFSRGNLTAFRELAMRTAAERVDAQMINYMRAHAIAGPWPAQDRLMVCISHAGVSKKLVRTGRRMAERSRIPWIVVYIQTVRDESLDDAAKTRIAETMRLAEELGADTVTLPAGSDMIEELLALAHSRNVTQILVGHRRKRWTLFRRSFPAELLRRGGNFEVTVVREDGDEKPPPRIRRTIDFETDWRPYAIATATVALSGLAALGVDQILPLANLSLVFLFGVLFVAIRYGLWPSMFTSVLSFVIYNYFFTPPLHVLTIASRDDALTLAFFLIMAFATGQLASRFRDQVESIRRTAKRTGNLYDFSRRIVAAASLDDVAWAVVHHVASTLQCRSLILMPNAEGSLEIISGFPPEDQLSKNDWGAAEWAWHHNQPAGWNSDTLPGARWLFLPLRTAEGAIGLAGVAFDEDKKLMSADEQQLLDALVDQAAVAIERTNLASDIEDARLLSETEKLRTALLSSVSHDLRTPLVSIMGSATTLSNVGDKLSSDDRAALAHTIQDESERLNRFVQNLLDMTRLGYGVLKPKADWAVLGEIVGRAVKRLERVLLGHNVSTEIAKDMPLIHVDPVLIEQVLVNVLDNAAKYSPPDSPIAVKTFTRDGAAVVQVTDQGIGIPPEEREQVFDMFYRVRAGDKQVAGTGLGLSICRGLIEAHGGRIAALPGEAGRGTTIEFTLPLKEVPEAALGSAA
jgi:two-component system sensor histidine kinase KdpD